MRRRTPSRPRSTAGSPDVADHGEPVLRHGRLLHRAMLVRPGSVHARRACRTPSTSSARTTTASSRATRRASAAGTAARTGARCSTRLPRAIPDDPATGPLKARTFTDLTYDTQDQPPPPGARWPAGEAVRGHRAAFECLWAPNNIHPTSTRSSSTRRTRPRSSRARTAG